MPMSRDDEDHFRPRPGRIRSDGRGGAASKSFFTRVRKIARQHGAEPPGASPHAESGGKGRARGKIGASRGVRRGRGAAFARGRTLGERGWGHRQPGARRVVVKSRSVRAAGKNGRAAAHLRYIQRDGTSRDGERGRLYSATQDRADVAGTIAISFASSSRPKRAPSSAISRASPATSCASSKVTWERSSIGWR